MDSASGPIQGRGNMDVLPSRVHGGSRGSEDIADEAANAPVAVAAAANTVVLRKLPSSDRHFWDTAQPKHLLQNVFDQAPESRKRKLPENEIVAMALNEVAASLEDGGRGFFYHLRNRDAWKKAPGEETCPKGRVPVKPGPQFPSLVYMNYVWDGASRNSFLQASHRSRYLKCDGLINLPPPQTPLYAIQYATYANYPVYLTPSESLAVIAAPRRFYLATVAELDHVFEAANHQTKPRSKKAAEPKIKTLPFLWTDELAEGGSEMADELIGLSEATDVKALYKEIVRRCRPGVLPATFAAAELYEIIPRPSSPERGKPLGTKSDEPASAPSRRGGFLKRGRGGRRGRGRGQGKSPAGESSIVESEEVVDE